MIICLAVSVIGCSADGAPSGPDPFVGISADDPLELPVAGSVEHGVAYRFALGHCGLLSTIQVDGSYWDEVDGRDRSGARRSTWHRTAR